MKLEIRPPGDGEWPVCRMLLPETFAEVSAREYLVYACDQPTRIAAVASFRRSAEAITHLRLHVVPPFRQQGVGSHIVAHLGRIGACSMEGIVEIAREPGGVAFCGRNGFERVDALTTVEAEIAGMREYLGRLRGRMAPPAGARVIPLSEAPLDQVARLHAELVAHEDDPNAWRARVAGTPGVRHSPVVLMAGRVVGILLWELERGTAVVRSRVAAPGHQSKWVNALLLAEGLEGAWSSGARRVRFTYTDSNRDTRKLARRFQAEVTGVIARFRRNVVTSKSGADERT